MSKFLAIFLVHFVSSLVFAQSKTVNAPFLKIEKNGEVSYMLGTIHTGLDYSLLPENIRNLAKASQTLVVETDINAGQALVAQAFPPGAKDSLKNQLTPEEWAKFTAVVEPILGPQANFVMDRLHPAIATSIYSSASFPDTKEPIDRFLVQQFMQEKKPVMFFEDVSVQIDVLAETQTIDTLKLQLQVTQAQMDQQSQLLLFIYSSGNLQLIEQFLVNPMPKDQLVLLLDNRNLAWQAKFDSLFNEPGQEFFAVGAAHLPGKLGMMKLLQDIGYTVTQIQH